MSLWWIFVFVAILSVGSCLIDFTTTPEQSLHAEGLVPLVRGGSATSHNPHLAPTLILRSLIYTLHLIQKYSDYAMLSYLATGFIAFKQI